MSDKWFDRLAVLFLIIAMVGIVACVGSLLWVLFNPHAFDTTITFTVTQ